EHGVLSFYQVRLRKRRLVFGKPANAKGSHADQRRPRNKLTSPPALAGPIGCQLGHSWANPSPDGLSSKHLITAPYSFCRSKKHRSALGANSGFLDRKSARPSSRSLIPGSDDAKSTKQSHSASRLKPYSQGNPTSLKRTHEMSPRLLSLTNQSTC